MMNKYAIKELQMINYKVFKDTTLTFDNENLCLFDGPNGYGKTSIFEAIEYAMTGRIGRMQDNTSVNGTLSYNENPLAQDPSLAVEIILTLSKNDKTIKISRKIPPVIGKQNNPKEIFKNTQGTLTCSDGQIIRNTTDIDDKLAELFEIKVNQYFRNIYYIPQEDRLKFLSGNTKDRKTVIDYLINIKKQKDDLEIFEKFKKKLDDNFKDCNSKIEENRKLIAEVSQIESQDLEVYINLLGDIPLKPLWDKENAKIDSDAVLKKYQKELGAVYNLKKEYIQNNDWNQKVDRLTDNPERIKDFLIVMYYGGLDCYLQNKKNYDLAKGFKEQKSIDIDYVKINTSLNLELKLEDIKLLKNTHALTKSNLGKYDTNLTSLKSARKKFIEASKKEHFIKDDDRICYNCGHKWQNANEYEEAMLSVEKSLKELSNDAVTQLEQLETEIETYYQIFVKPILKKILEDTAYVETVLTTITKEDINFKYFEEISKALSYNVSFEEGLDFTKLALKFIELVNATKKKIPDNISEHINTFSTIYNKEINLVKEISDVNYTQKGQYLEQCHNEYLKQNNDEIVKRNKKLEEQISLITNSSAKIKKIIQIYKAEISTYYKDILSCIKVPVYIYTGRILQNFKGGLGIHVVDVSNMRGGLSEVRFSTDHVADHDILYTLSSGQLSGFIIAFTLMLNKAYGSPGLKTILIDDPVQTMDDLNIVSLTDILRNDFKDYQIILSTHEEKFSDFIQYRYHRYNLPYKKVNVLELMKNKGDQL